MNGPLLVTGGAGFIGSHLCRLLHSKGYSLVILDKLTYAGNRANLGYLLAEENVTLIEGDINDKSRVLPLLHKHAITGVFHLAAESHVDHSISNPAAFIETNITGTYQLLDASTHYWSKLPEDLQSSFRFIHVSTDEVYGSLELGSCKRFCEDSPYQPHSPYAASKAASDHLVQSWHDTYGLPTLITHCSNNFGSHQYPEKLIPFFIQCALNEQPLGLYGDGQYVRDWITVESHCLGLYLAWQKGRVGDCYNFGSHQEYSNYDLTLLLCDLLDRLHPRASGTYRDLITFIQDRPGHDRRYAIDNGKATTELGFVADNDFPSALESTIRWYLRHPEFLVNKSRT